MLELTVHDGDKNVTLQFEHSLLSLSKWESKHQKPFLDSTPKKASEMIDYYMCMLLSPDVDPTLVYRLEPEKLDLIGEYIAAPQSASFVPEEKSRGPAEIVTSELVYYWLVSLQIPFEVQTWHLSRVMMLVRMTTYKNSPPEKRNLRDVVRDMRSENERRKKMFNTKG